MIPDPFSVAALPRIVAGCNDILTDEQGRRFIDLFSAHGAAFLGHANPRVALALAEQLHRLWITGGLPTRVLDDAKAALESFFPATHHLAGLYSTGMEAAEFALRLARSATGRPDVIGFTGGMHGKSLATSLLAWDNTGAPDIPFLHRLPFIPARSEEQVLTDVQRTLASHAISAILVEPLQASSGGHAASPAFHQSLQRLCQQHGALLIFDEILTGFHRTGTPFLLNDLLPDAPPDVILIGKAIASGFPAAAVMARRDLPIDARSLPGSTFAGNALAAAAVSATLSQMRALDLVSLICRIQQSILDIFSDLPGGITLRGRGALWVLELPPPLVSRAHQIITACYARGVFVSHTSRYIRLLPAATIEPANLAEACAVLREELLR